MVGSRALERSFWEAVETSALLVGALSVAFVVELVVPFPFKVLGIYPRTLWGLLGIGFSPLLHANTAHLVANAAPLFVLLTLLFWDKHYFPVRTLVLIWVASGLGTWFIGRAGGAVHIGASSIIYGLVAYLIVAGMLMQSWRSAIVAVLVFVFYGGLIYGLLPQPGFISWEGHFSGALAGIWAARNNHE